MYMGWGVIQRGLCTHIKCGGMRWDGSAPALGVAHVSSGRDGDRELAMQKALAVGVRVMSSTARLRTRAVGRRLGTAVTLVGIAPGMNLELSYVRDQ
jgi:hypothetical protein